MLLNRHIHALMSTARVANVPSVVCNVILGVVAAALSGVESPADPSRVTIAGACLAGSLLYIAGNFFNDWMDRDWDARHRPERALPSGVFRAGTFAISALLLGMAGVVAGALAGFAAGWISVWIVLGVVAYTVFHKRGAWAVVFMGFCRACLVWLGAAAVSPDSLQWNPGVALASAAVFCYIAALSLAARREYSGAPDPSHGGTAAAGLFLLVPILMMVIPDVRAFGPWCAAGLIPYGAWMFVCQRLRGRGPGVFVSALLAGIPVVDWILLLPVGIHELTSRGGVVHDVGLVAWIVPPISFVSALALQRTAPAT